MNFLNRTSLVRIVLAVLVVLAVWQHTLVLDILFTLRGLVYEQPFLLLSVIFVSVLGGVLLSFKNIKILPLVLSGLIVFAVVFNLFASYQEVTKFGINQDVFSGLVNVLVHSAAFPLVLASADVSTSSLVGGLVIVLIMVKGVVIVKKWFKTSILEQILLSCAFGFGITCFLTFVLAALQLLTIRNVVLTDIAFFSAVFLLPRNQYTLPQISIVLSPTEKKVWTFIGFILFLGFIYAALFPPLEWDSLAYQAYYSKLIYENQGLPVLFGPSIGIEMSAAYPPAYQMLGCYTYVLAQTPNVQFMSVLSYVCGVLSLVCVFFFAHITVPTHRMYAVLATVGVPFFLGFSASPHYMTLLIFFISLYLLYLSLYLIKKDIYALYVSVTFLGFACLTSYLALASFLFLVIAFIKQRFPLKTVIIPTILALPPLIRNFWFTGNPLFPLFGLGRQLQNPLWESNTFHFDTQTVYAGLHVLSPFSILDFFMNRISSVRPLLPLVMVIGIIFLIFVRPKTPEKKWLLTWFLASVAIFFVRPTFDRYLLIYIPVYSSVFAWLLYKSEELSFTVLKRSLQFAVIASLSIVVVGILITGPLMIASHVKQFPDRPLDDWAYVRQFYPHDTPCWRFLNENTPPDAYVATYDIRYYYIDKHIFSLDGIDAVSLYSMSEQEALTFLKERNVVYWFSSRWTSPADDTCPPAYYDNPLTSYLGSDILPLVFVSGQSAVYHIGKQWIDYQDILETESVLYPVNGFEYTFDHTEMVYFDIPGDFHGKTIVLWFSTPVTAGMYKGHAASPALLGELVEKETGLMVVVYAYSGKYTLYLECEEPFTLTVLIQ